MCPIRVSMMRCRAQTTATNVGWGGVGLGMNAGGSTTSSPRCSHMQGGGCKLRVQKMRCRKMQICAPRPVKMVHVTQICPWIATINGT